MKPIFLIALLLISSTVILADGDDNWSHFEEAVKAESAKLDENKDNELATRATFPCTPFPRSNPKPTSVHKLQPADIDVIAAIGDSLTAANGARASLITSVLTEYRGASWSIGGDDTFEKLSTLPNIFRKFNPNIYGFSTGSGKVTTSNAKLNLAEPGHTSHDMYNQAVNLVNRMRSDPNVNMDNDWKLITFFIGGNDLCNFCDNEAKYTALNYVNNIRTTLYYFKNNLKRTFINLVLSLDVRGVRDLDGSTCRNMQKSLCGCGLEMSHDTKLAKLTKDIQQDTAKMIDKEGFNDRDDFAVVIQPFMTEMEVPKTSSGAGDKTYFAPDCFHFSVKGHSAAGVELWNNMLQPVGQKNKKWESLGTTVRCPTATSPFLFTPENSRSISLRDRLAVN